MKIYDVDVLPYSCYEVVHTYCPSCSESAVDGFARVFRNGLTLYASVYTVSALLRKGNKLDWKDVKAATKGILQSSTFLACNGFGFMGLFCVSRHLTGHITLLRSSVIPAFVSSLLAIFIERPSRRPLLALYVTNIAIETLYRMLKYRNVVKPLPYGEAVLLALAMGGLMRWYRTTFQEKNLLFQAIKFTLGAEEMKKEPKIIFEGGELKSSELNQNYLDLPLNAPENREIILTKRQELQLLLERLSQQWKILLSVFNEPSLSCQHANGCLVFAAKGFWSRWLVGSAALLCSSLALSVRAILKGKHSLKNILLNQYHYRGGAAVAVFVTAFKLWSCALRRITGKDKPSHSGWAGFGAGVIAGRLYPSSTIALTLACKTAETLYREGMLKGHLPSVSGFVPLLYSLSTAVLFHASVVEPHNLRPSYWRFLNQVTGNRMGAINRKLLDIIGADSSSIQPNFWPDYDFKHLSTEVMEMSFAQMNN